MKQWYRKWISVVLALSLIAAPLEQIGVGFGRVAYAMTQPASGGFHIRSASESDASRDDASDTSKKQDADDIEIEDEDDLEDEDEIFLATDSDAEPSEKTERNPFDLADEDMPASYEELFGFDEDMVLSLAEEDEAEDTDTVAVKSSAVFPDDFVIRYTSVSMEQKEFQVTSDMKKTANLLTTPHTVDFEDGTYRGFRVVSLMLEVAEAGQDDSDEEHTLVFYVDEIVSGNFYINVKMEMSGGNRFTEGLYYTKDVNDESGTWRAYSDAGFTSGRYTIKLKTPYGAFVAKPADAAAKEGNSKALILVQTGDESLQTGPEEDAEALRSALTNTGEFLDENVTVMEIPQDTAEDYKTQIWNWIDEAAKEERLTLIAYTGHGDYHDDGTSELSLGGAKKQNTIQAVELKQHVAKLSGQVMLVLDCCFSGGMIMPTMDLEDETSTVDVDKALQEEQEKADQSLKTFVKDFRGAKAKTADTSGPSYYIYAAASAYETSIQKQTGGELITALCHALGYDRNDAAYNIYAADVDSNYEISAKELKDAILRTCSVATPSIYLANEAETLFTYGEDDGIPAVLSMTTVDGDQNILVQSDNSIQVKVKVKNYSSETITFDAMMGEVMSCAMDTPGTWENVAEYSSGKLICHDDINRHNVAAGSEQTFTLTFQADKEDAVWLKKGGRYLVRIWGCGDTDSTCYAISDFYIGSAKIAKAPDPEAFDLKKPACVYSASEAVEVSSILPINVAFDQEPVDKQGYAACTLTARYVDLGETDGSLTKEDRGYYSEAGNLMLNGSEVSDDDFADKWTDIYTDVRPVYTRKDILGDNDKETVTGSCYNYEWNVTGLTKGHYYLLQILCNYDNDSNSNQKIFTFIKAVDPSANIAHVISELNIRAYELASYSGGGIALKGDWADSQRTVKATTDRLENYWNTYNYLYNAKNEDITYSIATKDSTGWYECLEDGSVREMKETETFVDGKDYVNRLIMKIDADYNAVFADWANVQVGGHSLANLDGRSRNLSDDKKTLTVYILHKNVTVDDSGFHVYLAGTKTPVTEKTKLEVGTEIDVYTTEGWSIDAEDDSGLQSVSDDFDGFMRFKVQSDQTKIRILLYHKLKYTTEDDRDCACATLLFEHEIANRSSEIGSVSVPKKTFYAAESKKLDLSGSVVTLYDANRKATEIALSTFLNKYKAKLYTSSDDKNFTEWTDDNFNQLGTWELFVSYNGAYYRAFTIQVGYEQGDDFTLQGNLTYNQQGDASYVSDEDQKKVVLFVTSSFEATDDKNGIITCEHDLRLPAEETSPEDTSKLYPADGAKFSYLLPYPDLKYPPVSGKNYEYKVVGADVNVPVSIEKREDGLWVTTTRNGEFQIQYSLSIGGDDGGMIVPDEDEDDTDSSSNSGSHSSEKEASPVRTYGEWIPETSAFTQKTYRFRMSNGEYATGWRWIFWQGLERWFYFGTDGIMRTGWVLDNGNWYYLRPDGDMAVGWILDQGRWYYLQANGSMATGWIKDAGTWYYLQPDGALAEDADHTKTV